MRRISTEKYGEAAGLLIVTEREAGYYIIVRLERKTVNDESMSCAQRAREMRLFC